ncbi:hypothetical protein GWA97_03770 [Flavobacterium sp. LaA7.5]|nr:hypothetical protein [Flavobacterium salilacus subsp. altitudinum]
MRKLFLNLYVFVFLLASDYALYAQPGDTDGDDDVEGGSDPVAPINTKLILLAIVAIGFAYYYFSKRKQEKLTSN